MGASQSRLGFCNDDWNEKETVSALRKNIIKHHIIMGNQRRFAFPYSWTRVAGDRKANATECIVTDFSRKRASKQQLILRELLRRCTLSSC